MMNLLRYNTRRIRRDDRLMRALVHDLQLNVHVTTTKRHHYFILEMKFLFVSIFISLMDLIFYFVSYLYLFIAFRGNMQMARLNPEGNRMLQ